MSLGTIPLAINIFERGSGGSPANAGWVTSLQGLIDSYEHTIKATFGFESMSCSFVADFEEAILWLDRLMYSTVVYGPDADVVWEGYLNRVDVVIGQERLSIALDQMANRVRVRYTTVLGTPGTTATASDTTSQGLYGMKDAVLSLPETTAAAAENMRTRYLNNLRYPKSEPASEIASGDQGEIRVTLYFLGWYETLGWLLTNSTTTTSAVTTTQVGTLLTTIASTNNFISTSTANITASGISDTQYIAPDTSYRQKIEALLQQGNSNNERLAWGVYEDRTFYVKQWAGATPDTITYRRYLGDDVVYDSGGGIVEPWAVRPDAMYEVVDIVGVSLVTASADEISRYYVERVRCRIDGNGTSVTLEPQESSSLDALIARFD